MGEDERTSASCAQEKHGSQLGRVQDTAERVPAEHRPDGEGEVPGTVQTEH